MPDDQPGSSHVSLRVPTDVVAAFDRLAAILERPRSWVMVRATSTAREVHSNSLPRWAAPSGNCRNSLTQARRASNRARAG